MPKAGAAHGNVQDSSGSRDGRHGGRGRANEGRGRGGRGGRGRNQAAADSRSSVTVSSTTSSGGKSRFSVSSVSGRAVYGGADSISLESAEADSSQHIGQAGSGAATGATVPSAYSTTWPGWAADSIPSMLSAGAQLWRKVTLGTNQGSSAGVVYVDRRAECIRADPSLPISVGTLMARVICDYGSALTSIGVGLLEQISSQFGGVQLQHRSKMACKRRRQPRVLRDGYPQSGAGFR